jgi:hypothetical protein
MNNVISLKDRLENWNTVFESNNSRLRVLVSTHGRIRIESLDNSTALDLVQGADFLSSIQKGISSLYNNSINK